MGYLSSVGTIFVSLPNKFKIKKKDIWIDFVTVDIVLDISYIKRPNVFFPPNQKGRHRWFSKKYKKRIDVWEKWIHRISQFPFFQLGDFVICGLFSNNNNNRSGLVGVCVYIYFCEWDVVLAPCFVTRGRLISNVFRECIDVQKTREQLATIRRTFGSNLF